MIVETTQGNIEWQLPESTKTVMMKISGGLDSAITLYMLCKYIQSNNLNISIVPQTTNDWQKPYQVNFSTDVVSWMKNHFPEITFLPHETIQLNHGDDYIKGQEDHRSEIIKRYQNAGNPIDVVVSGPNRKPPKEICETFIDKETGKPHTGPTDDRTGDQPNWSGKSFYPIRNIDKQGIAELYTYYNLHETLAKITRSCEGLDSEQTNNFTTHCGECWWCQERAWGFGYL